MFESPIPTLLKKLITIFIKIYKCLFKNFDVKYVSQKPIF